MMAQIQREMPVLDYNRMQHGTFLLRISLILLLWVSLLLTVVFSGGAAAGAALGAAVAFPIWGTVIGGFGVRGARDKAAKEKTTHRMAGDDWVTAETHRLCDRLGMAARPWVATMPVNNAYAIGSSPERSMVVIGTPLLTNLSREEVSAIIGHELGHIANNDMRRMVIAESFQRSLTWYLGWSNSLQAMGRWALNWVAELGVLALSRKREYWADAVGAALTSKDAMRSALIKIHQTPAELTAYESRNARLMFRGKGSSLFSTHPTLEQRVAALEAGDYLRRLPHIQGQAAPVVPLATQSPAILPDAKDVAWARKPEKDDRQQ